MGIDAQISSMGKTWPRLKLAGHEGQTAIWTGDIRPLMQSFTIVILYRAPTAVELLDRRGMKPIVRVVAPQLRPRRGDPEGQLPHVYYHGPGPLDVHLCLFDTESDEWSPAMSLAETTVPWTIDWLTAYEGWRATGKWSATGKHLPRSAAQ